MTISKLLYKFTLRFYSVVAKSNTRTPSMNVFNIQSQKNYRASVDSAVNVLVNGGVIALPTDTIYGLAALSQNEKAVEQIYKIKKRRSDKPLAICVANIEDVYLWGKVTVSKELLKQMLPGPVTLIFERSETLNPSLNPDTNLVGIRIPDHDFVRDISFKCDSPIALTSANISSEKSPLEIEEFKELWGHLCGVYDGGVLGSSEQSRKGSTIIDLSISGRYKIVRKGCAFLHTTKLLHQFGLKKHCV